MAWNTFLDLFNSFQEGKGCNCELSTIPSSLIGDGSFHITFPKESSLEVLNSSENSEYRDNVAVDLVILLKINDDEAIITNKANKANNSLYLLNLR